MPKENHGSVVNRNGKFYARLTWLDATGKRKEITRKASTEIEARKIVLPKLITQLKKSKESSSNQFENEKRTFEDLANHYEKHYAIPPVYVDERKIAGLRAYRDVIHHICVMRKYFHRIKLKQISYSVIEQFKLDRLRQPLKRNGKQRTLANVHRTLSILRTMLNIAEREQWIDRNPFQNGKPLINMSLERPRERILSRNEEQLILALCTDNRAYFRVLLIAGLDTGMRRGEILMLRWADIDFIGNKIHVKAMNTKAQRGRILPLSKRLKNELLLKARLSNLSDSSASDRIFSTKGAGIPKMLKRICHEAEISNLRYHDLRHTFATRMIQAEMPLAEVSRLLGHTTLNITYVHYINSDERTLSRAMELLNKCNDENETAYLEGKSVSPILM